MLTLHPLIPFFIYTLIYSIFTSNHLILFVVDFVAPTANQVTAPGKSRFLLRLLNISVNLNVLMNISVV